VNEPGSPFPAAPGAMIVPTGPPGAGKTTVARLLAGSLPASVHLHSDDFWRYIQRDGLAPYLPQAHPAEPDRHRHLGRPGRVRLRRRRLPGDLRRHHRALVHRRVPRSSRRPLDPAPLRHLAPRPGHRPAPGGQPRRPRANQPRADPLTTPPVHRHRRVRKTPPGLLTAQRASHGRRLPAWPGRRHLPPRPANPGAKPNRPIHNS
jgi:hypothetical protein